jgi:hypothetical protein
MKENAKAIPTQQFQNPPSNPADDTDIEGHLFYSKTELEFM